MRFLLIIVLLALAGCSTHPASPFEVAVNNFEWVADSDNAENLKENIKSIQISDINHKFRGDCDDFAASLQDVIGGDIWVTFVDGQSHAVLVKDNVVYDYLTGPKEIKDYPGKLYFWFDLSGNTGS